MLTLLVVVILLPLELLLAVVTLVVLNQRSMLPRTRNYAMKQREREARQHLLLARMNAVENRLLDEGRRALGVGPSG